MSSKVNAIVFGWLIAIAAYPSPAAVGPLFGTATSYSLGGNTNPHSVATGDFNGDGIADLVAADAGTGSVSVLLGNPDGTFQPAGVYAAGSVPNAVVVADFNLDGRADIAVSDGYGDFAVSILLGNGDGTFQPAHSYPAGRSTNSLAVGDFNGDGKPDLVVGNAYNGGKVLVLLGNGDGTFGKAVGYAAGKAPFAVAIGDFNGDGKLDLAVANFLDDTVSILLGNGNGTFGAPASYHVGHGPTSLAVADLNGDGKPDVAVIDGSAFKISVLLNNGDGTLGSASTFPVGNTPTLVTAADLNGDGTVDLAIADWASRIDILLGDGKGGFAHELDYMVEPGTNAYGLAALDLNGDGRADLVSAVGQGNIDVLLNLGAAADATLSGNTLAFPLQLIGTSSQPQNVTLTNNGTLPLTINGISSSSSFPEQNTCGNSVFIDVSCNLAVKFRPQKKGLLSGTATITDNAPDSPQTIALSGSATAVSLSPTSLNFGNVPVGTTSQPQTVTLTNVSTGPLTIINIKNGNPEFVQTNTCGTGLPGKGSCTITVTFTPTSQGATGDTLKINDSGGGSPQTVSLSGTGT